MTEKTSSDVRADRDAVAEDKGPMRPIIIGTIAGFFVVGGFCGVIGALFGLPLEAAVALGAFTGIWGGPGFGGMMGFVLYQSAREAEHEATLPAVVVPAGSAGSAAVGSAAT